MRLSVKRLGIAMALTALTSCSAVKLSYEKADWLLAQWAGRYVDLTSEQERALRTEVSDLKRWHRGNELPEYARLLDAAAVHLQAGMTRAQIEETVALVRARARVLGEQAGASFAPVLANLSEAQLREMEARFEADNRRFVKRHLSGSPQDQVERRSAWLQNQLEDWFGKLDRVQRERVVRLVSAYPDMPAVRLSERKRRQEALLTAARAGRAGGGTGPRLKALGDMGHGRPARVQAAMAAWERAFIDMLEQFEDSLTPAQRARGIARLRGYAEDFRELAGRQTSASLLRSAP